AGQLLDVLFMGFLVPMVAALGLRAHPRVLRKDPAVLPDAVLIVVSAGYVFVRLVVLSALSVEEPSSTKKILLGALCAVVAVWSAVLWRAVDLLLTEALPVPLSAAGVVAAACPALLAVAAAVRLRWQVEVDRRARHEARLHAEEAQRAGRLTTLASLVAASVSDLEDQLEEVCRRARAASVVMPEKGEQMLQQARRARDIVRE